jgi:geranylgeranyl reductase family protein
VDQSRRLGQGDTLMTTCDVLIVGGGPAGSSCAWRLREAGVDVAIMDRAAFPRDKVCAGWITPQVIEDLRLNVDEYRHGRTFQPIDGFRVGMIGCDREAVIAYGRAVSYGIRRCEFDDYLVRRSGARLIDGAPVASIERRGDRWIANGVVSARMLVGAGGHFCPVARRLNPALDGPRVVAAQEVEIPIDGTDLSGWSARPTVPELYFCGDLNGYGWCFRKGRYVNVGLGRFGRALPKATAAFVAYLHRRRKVPLDVSWPWRGHAYLVSDPPRRRTLDDGVLLVGDAAGLAYPQSGEGIRPAIESGLLAASAIVAADGRYDRERIAPYEWRLAERFGITAAPNDTATPRVSSTFAVSAFPWLLGIPTFVRRVLLDRWFLHAHEPALL